MILDNEKITTETELDTWYGLSPNGTKIAITEVSLFEYLSELENAQDPELAKIGAKLFAISKTDNYIEMPDGAILCKTIKEMIDHNMTEFASELLFDAKLQNIKNGYSNPDPMVIE